MGQIIRGEDADCRELHIKLLLGTIAKKLLNFLRPLMRP
jgi:hypothetical protein